MCAAPLPFSPRRVLLDAGLGGRHLPATIRCFLTFSSFLALLCSGLFGRGAAAVRCALTAMRHGRCVKTKPCPCVCERVSVCLGVRVAMCACLVLVSLFLRRRRRSGAWKPRAGSGLQQLRHAERSDGGLGADASQIPLSLLLCPSLSRSTHARLRCWHYRGISCVRSGGKIKKTIKRVKSLHCRCRRSA